jgi:hypothetical protein
MPPKAILKWKNTVDGDTSDEVSACTAMPNR